MENSTKRPQGMQRMRVGWIVIGILAALTALEFWMSVSVSPALPYLVATAFAKAALIAYYFMHVSQTWRAEGGHE
jgi:heme/copper-type cytochrome/quinol oxidase subunit 4